MPKTSMTTTVTTTTTTTVKLAPKLRAKLLKECQAWEVANHLSKKGEADKKAAVANVDALMSDSGEFKALEEGVTVDRFKAKMVFPTSTKWDEERLRRFLTPAQMEECRVTTPGRPYVKISAGKEE